MLNKQLSAWKPTKLDRDLIVIAWGLAALTIVFIPMHAITLAITLILVVICPGLIYAHSFYLYKKGIYGTGIKHADRPPRTATTRTRVRRRWNPIWPTGRQDH
jgi:hypothetical protein